MIYVDEVRYYPQCRLRFKRWCHMVTDSPNLEELHTFAASIGLTSSMFQPHPLHPHYDLVPTKRTLALRHGAKAVTGIELAQINLKLHL